jgi:hypothetical protein
MFAIVGQSSAAQSVWNVEGYTQKISFPPALAHAQVALTLVAGGDWAETAIQEYTHRPELDGVDKVVEGWWPIVGIVERLTSVTWVVNAGVLMDVKARVDIFWWGDVSVRVAKPAGIHVIQLKPGLAAAVYDSKQGTIRHVHEEVALPGAAPPDRRQLERRALTHARSRGRDDLGDVKTLVVRGDQFRLRRRLHVDVGSRTLVELSPK